LNLQLGIMQKWMLILTTLLSVSSGTLISVSSTVGAETSVNSVDVQSDFNGDGFDDIAIGVPGEDIGSVVDAGAVNVFYGSTSGLRVSAAGDGTGRADQFWNQNSPGVEDSAEASEKFYEEKFGASLAAGDFNGDGFDDLAIGVPGEVIATISGAGAVHVLYGSSSGLRTTSPADQFWHQNSPGIENNAEAGDGFGTSLSAGDFNGDGRDDLAIGVPAEDIGSAEDAGAVNVLYGSTSGLRTTSPADQFWHKGKPGVPDVEGSYDNFGGSLAAGDFNNDGRDDLAIGAPGNSGEKIDPDFGNLLDGIGGVHVLYGSSSGLQTSAPPAEYVFEGDDEFENYFTENAGAALAAGDFNNDGYDDLAIGVPGEADLSENYPETRGGGAVAVMYGSSSGLLPSVAFQYWTQDSPGVDDTPGSHENFGSTLAAGNFNNDAYDDLAIGVPGNGIDTISGGAVNVLYGSSSGLQTSSPADQFWHQNSPGVDNVAEHEDYFASSLSVGDFNNDGKDDLAIGVRGEDIGSLSDAGADNVLYGSSSGLQTSSPADQFWHQGKPGVEDVEEAGDAFGAGKIATFE
jgi:FG-GAP repeat protein